MVQVIILSFCMFLCTGCFSTNLESNPTPGSLSEIPEKREIPSSYFRGSTIVPLSINHASSLEISEWYDETSVLYIQENNGESSLSIYRLFTGESSVFFETDDWIVDVHANKDYSMFSVQTMNDADESSLLFLSSSGEVLMEIKDEGEAYSVFWSPYDEEKLLVVAYLPDWETEVYYVDVTMNTLRLLNIEQTYLQWISEETVAYQELNQEEANYQDVMMYHLDNGEVELWQENAMGFVNVSRKLSFSVTVDTNYDLYSVYTFIDNNENTVVNQLEVPVLNTYSDQWWIPFHTYAEKEEVLYYLRPKYSGDYFSYDDGYELMAYEVRKDVETKIAELEEHVPLAVSPNEDFLLIGTRLERILTLNHNEITSLLEEL